MQTESGKPRLLPQDSDGENPDVEVQGGASNRVGFILKVSLLVAFLWWFFGLYTVITTRSLAVLASLVDATIDLFAQGVLLLVNWIAESGKVESIYPVGVSRLEPVGVIVCAVVMTLGSGGVIYYAADTLYTYYPDGPEMDFTPVAAIMLAVVVIVKIVIWQIAKHEYERTKNVSLEALALDNFNDILSNSSSLIFASLTCLQSWTWWFDPVGGIFISLYIIRSWGLTGVEQANQLVGIQVEEEVLTAIREVAESQCSDAKLGSVVAYHFGPKCMVEVKIIMNPKTPLQEIRDASIKMQHHIEAVDEVERCFVQVDYMQRNEDDHDRLVPLRNKVSLARNQSGLRFRTALSMSLDSQVLAALPDSPGSRHRAQTSACAVDCHSSGNDSRATLEKAHPAHARSIRSRETSR